MNLEHKLTGFNLDGIGPNLFAPEPLLPFVSHEQPSHRLASHAPHLSPPSLLHLFHPCALTSPPHLSPECCHHPTTFPLASSAPSSLYLTLLLYLAHHPQPPPSIHLSQSTLFLPSLLPFLLFLNLVFLFLPLYCGFYSPQSNPNIGFSV